MAPAGPAGEQELPFNDALTDAPETINSDPYGEGWLFEVRLSDPGQLDGLLHSDAYAELVSG